MHWFISILAVVGHDPTTYAIFLTAYVVWKRFPWWIAAMRVAIGKDPKKLKRAREALRALEPPRR